MKIEKLSIIVLIFFVSMSLFSMERRRAFEGDYIDGMSRDPLYNELIRSICDEKDLNRVEGCLIIRRSELLEEAREKGIDDRDAYVAEGLKRFVNTPVKGFHHHRWAPLHFSVLNAKHSEIVKLLLAVSADPDQENCYGEAPLAVIAQLVGSRDTTQYDKALLVPFLKCGVSLPSSYVEKICRGGYYDILLLIFQSKIKMPEKVALTSGELVTPLEFSNDLMCRRYCLSDHCVNIILRYPELIDEPGKLRELKYGPFDDEITEHEIAMLRRTYAENEKLLE